MKLFLEIILLLLIIPYLPDALRRRDFPHPLPRLLWYGGLLVSEILVIFPVGLRTGEYGFSHVFRFLLCAALTAAIMIALLVLWIVFYACSLRRIVLNVLTAAEILVLGVTLEYAALTAAALLTLAAGIADGIKNP